MAEEQKPKDDKKEEEPKNEGSTETNSKTEEPKEDKTPKEPAKETNSSNEDKLSEVINKLDTFINLMTANLSKEPPNSEEGEKEGDKKEEKDKPLSDEELDKIADEIL